MTAFENGAVLLTVGGVTVYGKGHAIPVGRGSMAKAAGDEVELEGLSVGVDHDGAAPGAVEVVELESDGRACLELQEGDDGVLAVDVQCAELAAGRRHRPPAAENPGQIVELMAEVAQHAPALSLPRRVPLAVIPARAPVGQVLAGIHLNRQDALLGQETAQPLEARMKAQVVADEEVFEGHRRQLARRLEEGLLDQNGSPVVGCGEVAQRLAMLRSPVRDHDVGWPVSLHCRRDRPEAPTSPRVATSDHGDLAILLFEKPGVPFADRPEAHDQDPGSTGPLAGVVEGGGAWPRTAGSDGSSGARHGSSLAAVDEPRVRVTGAVTALACAGERSGRERPIDSERNLILESKPLGRVLEDLGADYDVVDEWSSRTACFSRYRSPTRRPADLVVKVCERWTEIDARTSFESARRLAALRCAGGARVLEFIAWSSVPPALVSEFVDGEELGQLVRRTKAFGAEDLGNLMFAAGDLLGNAHALPVPAGARPKSGGRVFRRPVLCAGDFAAYNFRVERKGGLVYMEPTSKLRLVSAYRDLAWFLGSVNAPAGFPRRVTHQLHRCFIRGYRTATPAAPWGPLDELLVRIDLHRRRRGKALRSRLHRQRPTASG